MLSKNVKNRIADILISAITISILGITACGGGGGGGGGAPGSSTRTYTPVTKSETYNSSKSIYEVETTGDVELTYTFDLGTDSKHVYYIFTNTNFSAETVSPSCLSNILNDDKDFSDNEFSLEKPLFSETGASSSSKGIALRGKPEISEFNRNPWKYSGGVKVEERKRALSIGKRTKGPLKSFSTGNTYNFMNSTATDIIPATCKTVATGSGKTLVIWVANDCWTGSSSGKAYEVDQDMVNAVADKFLLTSGNNDIFNWVTNIYGEEWGAHSYSDLISDTDTIHILLYDIDNDNSTDGGVLGFFWSKDNFINSTEMPNSNERIMFYMDAVMLATPEAGTWDITDKMPEEIISTLAHEFQHMIHFYQKSVLDGVESDTWINEMCSLVTEDLLADKLGVSGPAGTPGTNITDGRLPLFNYWCDAPLTAWLTGDDVLISYSIAYAFGAYLARNYEGANLFKDIVCGVSGKNVYGDPRDIIEAVNAHNGTDPDVTIIDLMKKWGMAVLYSNLTSAPAGYKYNNGSTFSSSTNSITYNLRSINLFNYRYYLNATSYINGPFIYSTTGLNNYSSGTMNRGSNIFYKESATVNTGTVTKKFRIPDGVKVTVVVK